MLRLKLPASTFPMPSHQNISNRLKKIYGDNYKTFDFLGGNCYGISAVGCVEIIHDKCKDLDEIFTAIHQNKNNLEIKLLFEEFFVHQFFGAIPIFKAKDIETACNQDIQLSIPIIVGNESQKDKQIFISKRTCNTFTYNKLTQYLRYIRTLGRKSEIYTPIAFQLGSLLHSIALGYHPTKDLWYLIDANNLPTKYVRNIEVLASYIILSFIKEKELQRATPSTESPAKSSSTEIISIGLQLIGFMKDQVKLEAMFNNLHAKNLELCERYQHKHKSHHEHLPILLLLATQYKVYDLVYQLLAKGISPNYQRPVTNASPLICAILNDNYDLVKIFLENKANPNIIWGKTNYSPIHAAVTMKRLDMVRLLYNYGANLNALSNNGTPLSIAANKGYKEIVKFLLSHKVVYDSSILYEAIKNGHYSVVKYLISHNYFHANSIIIQNCPPFVLAAKLGYENIVKLLLDHGADVYALSRNENAIVAAARNNHTETINILLNNVPNLLYGQQGIMAIYYAIQHKNLEIVVQLLRTKFINPNSAVNNIPLLITATEINSQQCIDALLMNKANINICDNQGRTALYIAEQQANFNLVKYLLEKGCAIPNPTPKYTCLLAFYVDQGNIDQVKILLNNNNCNQTLANQDTLLILAAKKGHLHVLNLLLTFNINAAQKNSSGDTALSTAFTHKQFAIIKKLLQHNPALINDLNEHIDNDGNNKLLTQALEQNDFELIKQLLAYGAIFNPAANRHRKSLLVKQDSASIWQQALAQKLINDLYEYKNKLRCSLSKNSIFNITNIIPLISKIILNCKNHDFNLLITQDEASALSDSTLTQLLKQYQTVGLDLKFNIVDMQCASNDILQIPMNDNDLLSSRIN